MREVSTLSYSFNRWVARSIWRDTYGVSTLSLRPLLAQAGFKVLDAKLKFFLVSLSHLLKGLTRGIRATHNSITWFGREIAKMQVVFVCKLSGR